MHYLLFIFPLPRLPLNLSCHQQIHPCQQNNLKLELILKAQRNPTRTTLPTNIVWISPYLWLSMLASTTLISCNFSALPFVSVKTRNPNSRISFIRTPNPNTQFLHFRKGVAFKSVRAPSTLRIQKTQLLKIELNWRVRTEMAKMEETGQHQLCFSCCGLDSSTVFSTSLLTRLQYHGLQPFHTKEKCFCFAFVFV